VYENDFHPAVLGTLFQRVVGNQRLIFAEAYGG
jgi:hypothetical protein